MTSLKSVYRARSVSCWEWWLTPVIWVLGRREVCHWVCLSVPLLLDILSHTYQISLYSHKTKQKQPPSPGVLYVVSGRRLAINSSFIQVGWFMSVILACGRYRQAFRVFFSNLGVGGRLIFFFKLVYLCEYLRVSISVHRGQKLLVPLELELQEIGSYLNWC